MSIAFYDILELEAEPAPAETTDRHYRIEVVLDARGQLVSAQTEPGAVGLREHLHTLKRTFRTSPSLTT